MNILIVEDEAIIRTALRKLLERHDYTVSEAGSVKEAQQLTFNDFQLIISDLRLPGEPGTQMIKLAQDVPVLIMTSYASLRSGVDAMKQGAADYIAKPFNHDEMISTVKSLLNKSREQSLKSSSQNSKDTQMIGSSHAMQKLYKRIEQVAPTSASVLIHGETGTGKELAAKAIHAASDRCNEALISINCAAIPENLIESELFGHEKGAFTGAVSSRSGLVLASDKGTLFLDEIGELPLEAQARLLRVLQEGEVRPVGSVDVHKVDMRLIAATHRDLDQRCKEGLFREDLYFRLNVIRLPMPALRERGEDIVSLAQVMIARYSEVYNKTPLKLSNDTRDFLKSYPWPGNVRELENAMQRAVILCEDTDSLTIDILGLDQSLVNAPQSNKSRNNISELSNIPSTPHANDAEDLSLEDYFQRFVLENQDSMSETELAKRLGVSRKCLWERRQKLGIPRKKNTAS